MCVFNKGKYTKICILYNYYCIFYRLVFMNILYLVLLILVVAVSLIV